MRKPSSARLDDLESVFVRNLEAVRSTLRNSYRLNEDEIRGAEEDLHVWFRRLARRQTAPPPTVLQIALLSAACQYGRSFQLWKLRDAPSPDAGLNDVLARQPEDVARDIQQRYDRDQS